MTTERDPVMPVTRYCDVVWQWLDLIEANVAAAEKARLDAGLAGRDIPPAPDRNFIAIAEAADAIRLSIKKSNYLYRRIYLGEPHRTEPCPLHLGHWRGYAGPGNECPHGCSLGAYDITGFLPPHSDLSGRSAVTE